MTQKGGWKVGVRRVRKKFLLEKVPPSETLAHAVSVESFFWKISGIEKDLWPMGERRTCPSLFLTDRRESKTDLLRAENPESFLRPVWKPWGQVLFSSFCPHSKGAEIKKNDSHVIVSHRAGASYFTWENTFQEYGLDIAPV
jgi:hypothetical protein